MPKGFFFENMVGGGGEGKKGAKKSENKKTNEPTIGGTIYLETKF